jgi:hypothetical protein
VLRRQVGRSLLILSRLYYRKERALEGTTVANKRKGRARKKQLMMRTLVLQVGKLVVVFAIFGALHCKTAVFVIAMRFY